MNLYYRTVALALLLVLVVCQGCASADLKTEKYQNACLGSDELVFVSDKKGSLVEAECVNGFYVPKNNSNVKVAELSFWLDEDDCGIWNIAIDGDPSEIMVLMVEKTICHCDYDKAWANAFAFCSASTIITENGFKSWPPDSIDAYEWRVFKYTVGNEEELAFLPLFW